MIEFPMNFIGQVLKLAENKVTVALSAGSDSVAVAHFLKTKYPKIELRCFHYDHSLREQNRAMTVAAQKFCKDFDIYNITAVRSEVLPEPWEKFNEGNLRTLRYTAMSGLGYVVTGHHLDDAVENYLFNCFNGVPEYLPIPLITPYPDNNFTVIRPFILTEKSEILDYIKRHKLDKYVVEDETNSDEVISRRNWIRHSIAPQIEEKGYSLKTVVRTRYKAHLLQSESI